MDVHQGNPGFQIGSYLRKLAKLDNIESKYSILDSLYMFQQYEVIIDVPHKIIPVLGDSFMICLEICMILSLFTEHLQRHSLASIHDCLFCLIYSQIIAIHPVMLQHNR